MNRIRTYLCLIWVAILFVSCVDTPASDEYMPGYEAHYMEVSQTELSFGSDTETQTLSVASSQSWLFSDYASWLTLSKDIGDGDSDISIIAEENLSADIVRTSVFYLQTMEEGWNFSKTIIADQKAATPYIVFSPESIIASGNSSQHRINITSNTVWTACCDADWLTLAASEDQRCIDITLSENLTNKARTAYVIVTGAITETFEITQNSANLSAEMNTLEYAQSGGSYLLKINSEVSWSANTSFDWIDVSPVNGNNGESNITISTTPNWESQSRVGSVEFYIGDNLFTAITIKQEGVRLSIASNMSFRALGESKATEVEANVSWKVLAKPDWISVTPESADGSSIITISADNNSDGTNRTGVIKFGKENLTQTAELTVSQDGKYAAIDNENLTIGSKGGKLQVSLTTNDSWTVNLANSSPWISVSKDKGEENSTIEFIVDDNPSVSSRNVTAIISSKDLPSIDVVIRQNARFLTVNSDGAQFFSKGGTSAPIIISTDGEYSISENTDWFSVNHEGDVITIIAEVNETGHVREGDITIALTDLVEGSMVLTLKVTQVAPGGNFGREDFTEDNIWDAKYGNSFIISVIGYTTDEIWDGCYGSGNLGKEDYTGDDNYDNDSVE